MRFTMRTYLLVCLLLLTVANGVTGQELSSPLGNQTDWSAVVIRAPIGFWYPSSFFNQPPNVYAATSYAGIDIIQLPASPPSLGHFGKNGKVVNGDYVLMYYVDLNTAPITKVWFYGLWPTVDQPVLSRGYVPNVDGQPLGLIELPLGTASDAQIRGTEGTVVLGVALLSSRNQRLETAWGATVSQVIRIDDTISGFPYGNIISSGSFSTASFTVGGAAHFGRH